MAHSWTKRKMGWILRVNEEKWEHIKGVSPKWHYDRKILNAFNESGATEDVRVSTLLSDSDTRWHAVNVRVSLRLTKWRQRSQLLWRTSAPAATAAEDLKFFLITFLAARGFRTELGFIEGPGNSVGIATDDGLDGRGIGLYSLVNLLAPKFGI
jgi:hypothetical protein